MTVCDILSNLAAKKCRNEYLIYTQEISRLYYNQLLKEWNTGYTNEFTINYSFGIVTYIPKLTKLERALK